MRRIGWIPVLSILAACSNATVDPPAILDTVRCVRSEQRDPLEALDVWEGSIQAFERQDAENPPAPGAVVFTGSSSIVFWQSVSEDLAPLPVLNRGFGGSTLPQATHYVDRIVLPYDPRAVVLYEGDNDIAFGTSADCVFRDLEEFVTRVRRDRSDLPIYVLAVKPSIARANLWDEMQRANELMAALASTDPDLTFLDVASPMFDENGELREDLFVEDGLHMSAAGYEVWSAVVRPVLLGDLQ